MDAFHVGLPCLKLSLKPSNQRHHGKAARTCSVRDAWREMNDERRGRDETIDHEMTKNNLWLVGNTELDMEQVIQAEIDRINVDKKTHGKPSLRCDCVSGIAMVEKVPMEIMEGLSKEEQEKLLLTSHNVVNALISEWSPEWKTVAAVMHFDEFGGKAPHTHRIIIPTARDADGVLTLNAKRDFNLKFFTFINREYPKRMREQGYPVKDCAIYDDMTLEEKEQHAQNKKEYGLEGFEFKRKKAAEQDAQIAENEKVIARQAEEIETGKSKLAAAETNLKEVKQAADKAEKQKEKASEEVARLADRSNDLNIKILSKEEVRALPEPEMTWDKKYYKVTPRDYRRILATAKQVDQIKHDYSEKHEALKAQKEDLKAREQAFEDSRKLPWKERVELTGLRVLKKSVEWLVERFPDNIISEMLKRALSGQDLTRQHQAQHRERSRQHDIAI